MIGLILDRFVPWRMRSLSFEHQATAGARLLTGEVVEAFLSGARPALRGEDRPALAAAETALSWQLRPFFWEGQSFGATARHAVGLRRGNPASRYFAPGFRFMFYTGVGFYNGVAPRYHLPRMSLDPARWSEIDDFAAFRALIAGGTSFAATALAGRVDRDLLASLEGSPFGPSDPWWRRGLMHGAGRAAWFLHMGDLPRLAELLDAVGEPGVAEGLGLAIAFTGLARPDGVLAALDQLPKRHQDSVSKGIRATLGVAAADDPRIAPRLAALPDPLCRWFAQGTAALAAAGRGPEMPARLDAALDDAVADG